MGATGPVQDLGWEETSPATTPLRVEQASLWQRSFCFQQLSADFFDSGAVLDTDRLADAPEESAQRGLTVYRCRGCRRVLFGENNLAPEVTFRGE